jgi:hypothetical protein
MAATAVCVLLIFATITFKHHLLYRELSYTTKASIGILIISLLQFFYNSNPQLLNICFLILTILMSLSIVLNYWNEGIFNKNNKIIQNIEEWRVFSQVRYSRVLATKESVVDESLSSLDDRTVSYHEAMRIMSEYREKGNTTMARTAKLYGNKRKSYVLMDYKGEFFGAIGGTSTHDRYLDLTKI